MDPVILDSIEAHAASWERQAHTLEAFPKFGGDPEAQRRWTGRTNAEQVQRLRYAAAHARAALRRFGR